MKPDFYLGRARGVRVRIGSDRMEWNGFGCNLFNLWGFFVFVFLFFLFFFFFVVVAIWVDMILLYW